MAVVNITNPKAGGDFFSVAKAVSEVVTNGTGTITKGFFTAGFYNAGSTDVTVDGKTLQAGVSKTYAGGGGRAYGDDITYDASSGTIDILVTY